MENIKFPNTAPMHKPQLSSAEKMLGVLDELAKSQSIQKQVKADEVLQEETISDDYDLDESARLDIEKTEDVVRDVLALFDVNYDELIRMDNKSIYSKAVAAKPEILEQVKQAKSPVVEALKIAMGFKPYAEFMEKYGSKPEDIKAAIRKEMEAEMKKSKQVNKLNNKRDEGTPFSQISGQYSKQNRATKQETLGQIFGR